MAEAAQPELIDLRIRSTEVVEHGGTHRIELSVFCPSRGSSTPLKECAACSKCHGFVLEPDARSGRLTCHVAPEMHTPVPRLAEPDSAGAQRARDAMRTRVSEIMDCRTLCIEASFPVDELMPLMVARNVSRVPVVDATGGPLGIVTRTDLFLRKHLDLTYRHTSGVRQVVGTRQVHSVRPSSVGPTSISRRVDAPVVRNVRDVMSGGAFALVESAPVARAAALMAYDNVESIVIISQQGRTVGLLSALDLARWIAKSHGFSVDGG